MKFRVKLSPRDFCFNVKRVLDKMNQNGLNSMGRKTLSCLAFSRLPFNMLTPLWITGDQRYEFNAVKSEGIKQFLLNRENYTDNSE